MVHLLLDTDYAKCQISRFSNFKGDVEENIDTIRADVNKEVTTALSDVQSVNQNTVLNLKEDLKLKIHHLQHNAGPNVLFSSLIRLTFRSK